MLEVEQIAVAGDQAIGGRGKSRAEHRQVGAVATGVRRDLGGFNRGCVFANKREEFVSVASGQLEFSEQVPTPLYGGKPLPVAPKVTEDIARLGEVQARSTRSRAR